MIRSLMMEDIPAMLLIERGAHSHPWTEGIFKDCFKVGYENFGIETDGRLVGYGVLQCIVDEVHLLNLCIDRACQGRGLGGKLLAHLIQFASDRMPSDFFLEVRASNHSAIALYSSFGFNEIGVRRGYYPAAAGREDAVMMVLSLRDSYAL